MSGYFTLSGSSNLSGSSISLASNTPGGKSVDSSIGNSLSAPVGNRRHPTLQAPTNNSAWQTGSNSRAVEFGPVFDAIHLMANFPEGHPYHLRKDVAGTAQVLLSVLRDNVEIGAPKIFTQHDDTLVMEWIGGMIEKYLSVSLEDTYIAMKRKGSSLRCYEEIEPNAQSIAQDLISGLKTDFVSSTASSNGHKF